MTYKGVKFMKPRQQEQDVVYIINGGDAYGHGRDPSQTNVVNVSRGMNFTPGVTGLSNADPNNVEGAKRNIDIDQEVSNLLTWLSETQGVSLELALKKAVITAAYIHDLTTIRGGKLLVQRRDNSVGEIVLK